MKYSKEKLLKIWDKAPKCNCKKNDCTSKTHRKCSKCKKTVMHYGAHISKQPKSKHRWDIDHIQPLSKGGVSEIKNLQATCVNCNREKANK